MFKTIGFANIQGHKETLLDNLSPGVNVIIGESDSGKTSLFRGLYWLFNNRPSGEVLRNWDSSVQETMAVEASLLPEKASVAISRENAKNTYLITPNSGEPISFQAIRSDVPSEITDLLRISPYNFQSQHQRYFLMEDTPGEVARIINELTGLNIIDLATKRVNTKIRDTNSAIESAKVERDSTKVKLEKFSNLEEIRVLIEDIEKSSEELEKLTVATDEIKRTLKDLSSAKAEMADINDILEIEQEMLPVLTMITEHGTVSKERQSIMSILTTLVELRCTQKEDDTWLELEEPIQKILTDIDEFRKMDENRNAIRTIVGVLQGFSSSSKTLSDTISTGIAKYMKILRDNRFCPACFTSPIDETILSKIEKEL